MKITIIGSTGFIGKFLSDELSVDFDVLNLSLRNENLSDLRKEKIDQIFSSDFIVNCASSLNPKTKNDFYLNEKFLSYLLSLNNRYKKKVIHLSSINTLIQNRMDMEARCMSIEMDMKMNDDKHRFLADQAEKLDKDVLNLVDRMCNL